MAYRRRARRRRHQRSWRTFLRLPLTTMAGRSPPARFERRLCTAIPLCRRPVVKICSPHLAGNHQGQCNASASGIMENPKIQKSLGAIASSLDYIGGRIGNALQVAMAMTAKTKVLRELKTVEADLAFAKQRRTQLEEENMILKESAEKGDSPEDDDLIRLQLETLLAEKARLAHENSVYARENQFLREVVEYHQLPMQDFLYVDEGIEEVREVYPIHIPFEQQLDPISLPLLRVSPGMATVSSMLHPPCAPPACSSLPAHPET